MIRTLSAAALLALMVPTMGRADDADSEKQVASLSKQNYAALVAGDTSALDALLSDDWLVIDPFGEVISKARQAKELKDGTIGFRLNRPVGSQGACVWRCGRRDGSLPGQVEKQGTGEYRSRPHHRVVRQARG